jgi:hypothetical protein
MVRKSTGEESDASSFPTTSGMKECRHETEESFQPVIHEEALTDHDDDADEEPTIAEDNFFDQITGPN